MSRETTFKEGAAVCGYEYSGKAQLESDIKSMEADVNYYKQRLLAMSCATPKDITPENREPLQYVEEEFEEVWDELQDRLFRLGDLYTIQLNEDCIDDGKGEQVSSR